MESKTLEEEAMSYYNMAVFLDFDVTQDYSEEKVIILLCHSYHMHAHNNASMALIDLSSKALEVNSLPGNRGTAPVFSQVHYSISIP